MSAVRPLLSVRELSVWFPNGNGGLHAVDRVSFDVAPQEFVAIVGPSGSGKTTLLRLLAGLLRPTQGEVRLEGESLLRPRRRTGFVFQQANLMPWRTVLRNIELPLELEGQPGEIVRRRAEDMVSLVGLEGFSTSFPRDLSGGMAQRVAIARALVHDPDLLLLDEPFGSLDALTRERMATELMRIWEARHVTVVLVTHSISEAVLLSDRVLVLSARPGRLALDLPIALPRPRSLAVTHTPEFGDLARRIRDAIQ
ncbi:MAG: ABC transporter ATP-binding protein [Anaerolineales bacterium]|nr:ABC transporter ATP-binding protein [Anaerolineales bacterium]